MKTCFALLPLLFFIAAHAQIKERKWDSRLTTNAGTYPYLKDGGHFLDFGIFASETEQSAKGAELLYQTKNRKIKIGLSAIHIKLKEYHLGGFEWTGSDPTYLLGTKSITALMSAFNYSYVLRRNSQLYSEVCLGAAFTTQRLYEKNSTNHSIDPAFQCTFLGYRLGRRIAGFAELGYGYKGILQFGVSGTF